MILLWIFSVLATGSIPRESGDDPDIEVLATELPLYSPRERG